MANIRQSSGLPVIRPQLTFHSMSALAIMHQLRIEYGEDARRQLVSIDAWTMKATAPVAACPSYGWCPGSGILINMAPEMLPKSTDSTRPGTRGSKVSSAS